MRHLKKAKTVATETADSVGTAVDHVGEQLVAHARASTICRQVIVPSVILLVVATSPAAAVHGSVGCPVPESLQPLLQLLHNFAHLAYLAGVTLGVIGFSIAGIMFIWPGVEMTQRAKITARNVLIGVIILLSARMIVSYLVSQLPVCT